MTDAPVNADWQQVDWADLARAESEREDFSAWLVAAEDSAAAVDGADAIHQLNGRVADRAPLADAATLLARFAGRPMVVIDAGDGADDAAVFAQLGAVIALAQARDWPLVVTMPQTRIDLVAAALDGRDAQLLCEPAPADWVGAIATAAYARRPVPGPSDSTRESEAARRARLNEEVTRIAAALARDDRRGRSGVSRAGYDTEPAPVTVTATAVREVIRARRLRDRFFSGQLFEDPAWDIMLDLFAARLDRAQVSVSSLCIASAVAPTTALRWIQKLTDAGLLEREPDPFDRRRAFMKLSANAVSGMTRYVAAVREAKLPLV